MIEGSKVVWSEEIGDRHQIIIFDLINQSRQQLTSDSLDHVRPTISGDVVIWLQGEPDGQDQVAGVNYLTGEKLILPESFMTQPILEASRLVWLGPIDLSSLINPIHYLNLETQTEEIIAQSRLIRVPTISGDIVVWEDYRNYQADIYGYNLATRQEFPIAVAAEDQEVPSISGQIVVWRDNRNTHSLNDYEIYGYDLTEQREFFIGEGGRAPEPKIWGNLVVWDALYQQPQNSTLWA